MFNAETINRLKGIETPFFYYDLRILDATLEAINNEVKDFPYHVHYAIKANTNSKVLNRVHKYGLGIDCVSGNEVKCALDNGFKPSQIAFAGVGKTDKEIKLGLEQGIFTFNVESLPELQVIDEIAAKMNKVAPVAIRFNPNVNAKTHHYITTGLEENKFGINYWELDTLFNLLDRLKHVKLLGLHFHIGSQIMDISVFQNLCNRVNELQKLFKEKSIAVQHINVGGGLGINYHKPDEDAIPDFKSFFNVFKQFLELMPGQELHFELGRSVVAQCSSLVSKVLYIKNGIKTNFAIIDAGMTELIRPALYQSYHKIENITNNSETNIKYDVVGPICESSDCFGKLVELTETKRGDLIAIRSTGAYGEVMTSSYNLRDKAKAIYHDEI
jgi:diaminopimelate decarboxylase